MTVKYCAYTGDEFIPPCPVSNCPAWLQTVKSRCVFIELKGKSKLSQYDVAFLYNLSERAAAKAIKEAKSAVTDAARIVIPALNVEPDGPPISLGGDFFTHMNFPLAKNQIDEIRKKKPVNAALRRRMLPGQFTRYVGTKSQGEKK